MDGMRSDNPNSYYECRLKGFDIPQRKKEKWYQKILKGELRCPTYLSRDVVDLIKGLLIRDPLRRLGSGPGKFDNPMNFFAAPPRPHAARSPPSLPRRFYLVRAAGAEQRCRA